MVTADRFGDDLDSRVVGQFVDVPQYGVDLLPGGFRQTPPGLVDQVGAGRLLGAIILPRPVGGVKLVMTAE